MYWNLFFNTSFDETFAVKTSFKTNIELTFYVSIVTILGDLWDFGQLFKAFGNSLFAQISHILRQFL